MATGAIVCWFLFLLAAVLVGGTVLVRGAVGIANRILGVSSVRRRERDDEELDEWIGYRMIKREVEPIPEPGAGKGMLMVLLIVAIDFLTGLLLRRMFGVGFGRRYGGEDVAAEFIHLIGAVIAIPIVGWALSAVLPTRFGRACLVIVVSYAIVIVIAAAILVVGSLFD